MMLKRLPRSFGTDMRAAAEGRSVGTPFQHTFSAASFFLPVWGTPPDFEDLHDENMALRKAIRQTLDDNGHLADGECCTLLPLKLALRKIGAPWKGDDGE